MVTGRRKTVLVNQNRMSHQRKLDLAWTRADLASILVLLIMSTAWFGWCSTRSRIEFTDQPIAQMQRVMSAADRIDPNKASAASMVRLRGIGTKRAQAIIDFREKHRDEPFKTPNDLTKINGIGLGTVRGIASYLSLPE